MDLQFIKDLNAFSNIGLLDHQNEENDLYVKIIKNLKTFIHHRIQIDKDW